MNCTESVPLLRKWPKNNLVGDSAERTIVKTGGSGSLGITLPKDELEKRDFGAGDQVIIMPGESPHELVIHLPPKHV